jgi:hypothetical protein
MLCKDSSKQGVEWHAVDSVYPTAGSRHVEARQGLHLHSRARAGRRCAQDRGHPGVMRELGEHVGGADDLRKRAVDGSCASRRRGTGCPNVVENRELEWPHACDKGRNARRKSSHTAFRADR